MTGAIMVKVPTDDLRSEQAATIKKMLMIFGIVGLLLIGLIYFSFERIIHHRLAQGGSRSSIKSPPIQPAPTRIADVLAMKSG